MVPPWPNCKFYCSKTDNFDSAESVLGVILGCFFWGGANGSQMGPKWGPIGSQMSTKIGSKSGDDLGVHSGGLPLAELSVLLQ